MESNLPIVVIGGGAAGFFGAITCKELLPHLPILLLEKTAQLLTKVRISGGGRCNVTHACFDPAKLVQSYPRGGKELRGAFSRFQPQDMVAWLEAHGVLVKAEEDGRMFPISDSSETIINCFLKQAEALGVQINTGMDVENIERTEEGFLVHVANASPIACQKVLIATGSNRGAYRFLQMLGHTIEPLLPSLFTFNVPSSPLLELAGIAVEKVRLQLLHLEQTGPLLLTHFGFSGPAVIKLSAWGAKELAALNYKAPIVINWLPDIHKNQLEQSLQQHRSTWAIKQISSNCPFSLPKNLWKKLVALAGVAEEARFSSLSNKQLSAIVEKLHKDSYQIDGKTTYKQEFVTCGGVNLSEVDFKTMQSKVVPGLYFAGEVLNVDGITGGFNFQNAWTSSWIAAHSIAAK